MYPAPYIVNMNAQELTKRGYRRISTHHGIVSRVDRPDWVEALARNLNRSTAALYEQGEFPTAKWADYYRRALTRDTLTLPLEVAEQVPISRGDDCAYVRSGDPREDPFRRTLPSDLDIKSMWESAGGAIEMAEADPAGVAKIRADRLYAFLRSFMRKRKC